MSEVEVKCEQCKKIYSRSRSKYNEAIRNDWKQFCSKECQGKYRSRNKKNNCKNCNKDILVARNIIEKSKTGNFFCNESCAATFNNKKRKHSQGTKDKISKSLRETLKVKKSKKSKKLRKIRFCICGCGYFKATVYCSKKCYSKQKRDKANYTGLERYRKDCKFKFSLNTYPNEFEFSLIEKYGWYTSKNNGDNSEGVSRDHIVSVRYGFDNNIDPSIISHPANCQLMQQRKNSSKNSKCGITLEELMQKVEEWNKIYKGN